MTSYGSTSGAPSIVRTVTGHGKLHKRGGSGSGSSIPGPPSALSDGRPSFSTPFATYEESYQDVSSTPSLSSTPKIKPYLRKMSTAKDDQGKIDLSRSVAENEKLAGLGIQDFGTRSAADIAYIHAAKRSPHARTVSVGSQVSNGSGTFRTTQPFVHPMRQTPRPYTPPTGPSYASSLNDDEARESVDVVEDDFRLGHGFRTRRSMSISSTAPTPLSQSHTVSDMGAPRLTTNNSQTNLSIRSGRSSRSRPRRDTVRSQDLPTSASSRTSLDNAMSFISRRSDPDTQTRDDRIRAARRKFEQKEAQKDRKAEKEASRREAAEDKTTRRSERQRRKSDAPEPAARHLSRKNSGGKRGGRRKQDSSDDFDARPYEGYRPSNEASLPIQVKTAGGVESEKVGPQRTYHAKPGKSGWVRFEAWFKTRLFSCGGDRR